MKKLLVLFFFTALAAIAQNTTLQKTPAQPAGSNANKLTDPSKVIVVGDGGSITASGNGNITATNASIPVGGDLTVNGTFNGTPTGGTLDLTALNLALGHPTAESIALPATTDSTQGVITLGGVSFLHAFAASNSDGGNFFAGTSTGNFTMGPGGGASSLASGNTGVGFANQQHVTTGYQNTSGGWGALNSTIDGYGHTAWGYAALRSTQHDIALVGIGVRAGELVNGSSGSPVTAGTYVGEGASRFKVDGDEVVSLGHGAGYYDVHGARNVFLGGTSGPADFNTTVNDSIALGHLTRVTASNRAVIGTTAIHDVFLGSEAYAANLWAAHGTFASTGSVLAVTGNDTSGTAHTYLTADANIFKISRGNGAGGGMPDNGPTFDSYADMLFRANQLGGSGGTINFLGGPVNITSTGNALTVSNTAATNTARTYFVADPGSGSSGIFRFIRGNGASGYQSNGFNVDSYGGVQFRANQLGGSGETIQFSGAPTYFIGSPLTVNGTGSLLTVAGNETSGTAHTYLTADTNIFRLSRGNGVGDGRPSSGPTFDSYSDILFRANQLGGSNGTITFSGGAVNVSDSPVNITSTGNALTVSNTAAANTARTYFVADPGSGSSGIFRFIRGNGASGYQTNGFNLDSYGGFQVRANQLGGSGEIIKFSGAPTTFSNSPIGVDGTGTVVAITGNESSGTAHTYLTGDSNIFRISRGNGAGGGMPDNGPTLDSFADILLRANQLGGSGGAITLSGGVVNVTAPGNGFTVTGAGSSGTAHTYIVGDPSVGSSGIFRVTRGNGAGGGLPDNGITIDSFADIIIRANQLGGSGGVISLTGASVTVPNGSIAPKVYTVAALPSASPAGQIAMVSDAATTVILGLGLVVTGGGANFSPVYSDGTNWRQF